jgi:hypothetical protein
LSPRLSDMVHWSLLKPWVRVQTEPLRAAGRSRLMMKPAPVELRQFLHHGVCRCPG